MAKSICAVIGALLLTLLCAPDANAGAVILEGGDVLHGVVQDDGEHVVLEHAVLGRLVIAKADIWELHIDGVTPPTTAEPFVESVGAALSMRNLRTPRTGGDVVHVAGEPCEPCPDPCAPEAPDPCASPWEFELGAALSLASGNSELFDVGLDGLAKYTRGRNSFSAWLAYVYGEQQGDRTAENWHGKARFDQKFSSRTYWFVQTLYDRDDFADLEHRITLLGGVGTELLKRGYSTLKAEVGGGVTLEKRFGQDWTQDPSAYLGLDYTYEHPTGRKFIADLDYLPNLNDHDLTRTVLLMRFEQPIGDQLSLSLGLRLEYVENPPGDVESLDTLLTAGLRLKL